MLAICMRCGATKQQPYARCGACGLRPKGEQIAKSLYLSEARFEEGSARRQAYRDELVGLAARLESGEAIVYPPEELARLRAELDRMTSWSAVGRVLFQIFRPGLVFLLIGGIAVVALRMCLSTGPGPTGDRGAPAGTAP